MTAKVSVRTFLPLIAIAAAVGAIVCKDLKKYTMGAQVRGTREIRMSRGETQRPGAGKCGDPEAVGVCIELESLCDRKYKPV